MSEESLIFVGGLLIMTGDVLPCFDAASLKLPENGTVVVTVPTVLSRATKHGVILCSTAGSYGASSAVTRKQRFPGEQNDSPLLVEDLLQKPSVDEMLRRGAVDPDGNALLDTGIFAVQGTAWHDLIGLALSDPNPINDILMSGDEVGGLPLFLFHRKDITALSLLFS
jgi:fucokinase